MRCGWRGGVVLSASGQQGHKTRLGLPESGVCGDIVTVSQPVSTTCGNKAVVREPVCKWHAFTFPSKAVTGSAVQFHSGVSIMPPHHDLEDVHISGRRHDGYTASC